MRRRKGRVSRQKVVAIVSARGMKENGKGHHRHSQSSSPYFELNKKIEHRRVEQITKTNNNTNNNLIENAPRLSMYVPTYRTKSPLTKIREGPVIYEHDCILGTQLRK